MRWVLTASSLVRFPWKHDVFMYIRKLLSVCYVLKIMLLKAEDVVMAIEKDVNVEKEETNGINEKDEDEDTKEIRSTAC